MKNKIQPLHPTAESGFSIMEVMIAMGMLGVVSMGSLTLFNQTQKNQTALTTSTITRDFVEDIRTMMSFSSICTVNFQGTQIEPFLNPIPVTKIKDANLVAHYETGSEYEGKTFRINSISLENYSSLSTFTGRLELVIDIEKLKSTGGIQTIRRKIPLVANLSGNGNGKIASCFAGGGASANTPQVCEDMGGRYDMNIQRCIFKQLTVTDYPNYTPGLSMFHVSSQAAGGDIFDVQPNGKIYFGPRPDASVQAAFASALGSTNPNVFLSNELSFGNFTEVGGFISNPAGKLMGYLGGNERNNSLIVGSYNKNVTSLRLWNWNGDPNVPGAGWDMGLSVRDMISTRQCVGPQWWCGKDDYVDKSIMVNIPNETLKVYENGSFSGTVFAGGTALTSDRRLKKNIHPLHDSLSKVLRLRGVEYLWREDSGNNDRSKQLGLIAQEVEKVFPDAITQTPNGFKSIKYQSLLPALIESVKEIWSHIQANEEARENLKSRLATSRETLAVQKKETQLLRELACEKHHDLPDCDGP